MKLFELRAVTAAVESSGQTKAEAQVSHSISYVSRFVRLFVNFLICCSGLLVVFSFIVFKQAQAERLLIEGESAIEGKFSSILHWLVKFDFYMKTRIAIWR